MNVSNSSNSTDSNVIHDALLCCFFNTRLVFFCMPLRYISERVERYADGIEMNVFGADINPLNAE